MLSIMVNKNQIFLPVNNRDYWILYEIFVLCRYGLKATNTQILYVSFSQEPFR